MDIERLKELTQSEDSDLWDYKEELIALIDAEIARQSTTSEEVQRAIEWVKDTGHSNQYMSGEWTAPMRKHINRTVQETIITALQAYQLKPDCESAEKRGDNCCGYGKSEYDDEPIDACKQCEKQASYEEG